MTALRRATVPEAPGKLAVLHSGAGVSDARRILEALKLDRVVLLRDLTAHEADRVLHDVTEQLGLLDRLELQASYAAFLGHRKRVGLYGMTVNAREDYQFVAPHCEGDSYVNIQLASFYCNENTTDGGETILMNLDDASPGWHALRERVTRIQPGSRTLAPGEMRRAAALYHLHSPPGIQQGERILHERMSEIPGLRLADVLAAPRKTHSRILERTLYVYWDSISSIDRDCVPMYLEVLSASGLLREPAGDSLDPQRLDDAATRRLWSSGVDHAGLFRCRVTHKLTQGELVILNNLSWAHAVNNWSPGSGVRNVSAAFA